MNQEWKEDLHMIILKPHSRTSPMTLGTQKKEINVIPRALEITSSALGPSETSYVKKKKNQKAAVQ